MAVLFHIMPWQMVFLPDTQRIWYEQAARRHMQREHEIRQSFLDALVGSFSGGGTE